MWVKANGSCFQLLFAASWSCVHLTGSNDIDGYVLLCALSLGSLSQILYMVCGQVSASALENARFLCLCLRFEGNKGNVPAMCIHVPAVIVKRSAADRNVLPHDPSPGFHHLRTPVSDNPLRPSNLLLSAAHE